MAKKTPPKPSTKPKPAPSKKQPVGPEKVRPLPGVVAPLALVPDGEDSDDSGFGGQVRPLPGIAMRVRPLPGIAMNDRPLPGVIKKIDHSKMKLGKRLARHDPRVPMLATYTASLPVPPAQADYSKLVKTWGMMVNDKLGDCTCAAVGHVILQWTTYNNTPVLLTDQQVISLYETVSGYNPANPSTDRGAVEVDVLNYWLNAGVDGHQLDGYAALELQNHTEVEDARLDQTSPPPASVNQNASFWFTP